MIKRDFGTTGIQVSALGFGAGQIGDVKISERESEKILNFILDHGITLIDTARAYGLSEERIGKYLWHRREEFILSTKVGYDVNYHPDWSYESVSIGIDEALKKLKTDYIDIVHLHSCTVEDLRKGEVIEALEDAIESSKINYIAYSGENEALNFAIQSRRFHSIQCSINIFDQRTINHYLYDAKDQGMGVIAKRPMGNAPWRFKNQPAGDYSEEYWKRMKKMNIDSDIPWDELALRFAAFTWGIDSCIVGTTNIEHIKRNLEIIEKGKLPEDVVDNIRGAFLQNDFNWISQV
ncbi:MAG: aldo/keto reductase [Melioribacteraceae bacterium]|nr:aldo/keto reductase [Melioribacteraceae bacterium]MCF8354915.1 aldo/keto reductase [Melioribacteraceae bacterium]MCF8395240.1 aldo/keto reductase [Melioribacteraceae bacterium]MCF8420714.1 aldo/keto reductase [Melioribacteraceae bacterium]